MALQTAYTSKASLEVDESGKLNLKEPGFWLAWSVRQSWSKNRNMIMFLYDEHVTRKFLSRIVFVLRTKPKQALLDKNSSQLALLLPDHMGHKREHQA